MYKQIREAMFDECIYFNITTLNRKITKIWNDNFERVGLSPSHAYLLSAIYKNPKINQKEIGELMELDASTITRFMDTLEQKGFIKKKTRGKGAQFTITKEGKKHCKEVKKIMDNLYKTMESHLGKKDFATFVSKVHSIKQSLNIN